MLAQGTECVSGGVAAGRKECPCSGMSPGVVACNPGLHFMEERFPSIECRHREESHQSGKKPVGHSFVT